MLRISKKGFVLLHQKLINLSLGCCLKERFPQAKNVRLYLFNHKPISHLKHPWQASTSRPVSLVLDCRIQKLMVPPKELSLILRIKTMWSKHLFPKAKCCEDVVINAHLITSVINSNHLSILKTRTATSAWLHVPSVC